MRQLKNIHPGEVLKEEFLDPMGISVYRLSKVDGAFTDEAGTAHKRQKEHDR